MELYRRTQIGIGIISVLAIGIFLSLCGFVLEGSKNLLLVALFLGIAGLLFSSLNIVITSKEFRISLGIGVVRKSFPISDIVSCEVVKNPWWYGWGVKVIPGGWLFSVSGTQAIEIKLKNGRRYRVGSDDPVRVKALLDRLLSEGKEA